jgi:ribulose-phosphate 3-epimerase
MKKLRIAPSILSADFARLGEEIERVLAAGADVVHFDVMDNHYVPNITIGPMVCEAIRSYATAPIDVHLMVKPVDALIPAFAQAGADIITIHPEATEHLDRSLAMIRDLDCRAGIALNPATTLHVLDHVIDRLDLILLMSVNPGFGGQAFVPETLRKATPVRKRIDAHVTGNRRPIWLEIGGGVKVNNIGAIAAAGVDTFVAGSAIFGARDRNGGYRGVIDAMRRALRGPIDEAAEFDPA